MRAAIYLLCCTLLGLSLAACLDTIELAPPDRPPSSLVIQGKLVAGEPATVTASIFELFVFNNSLSKAIEKAQVTLVSQDGARFPLRDATRGLYEGQIGAAESLKVMAGQSYRLEVIMPDGRQYQSAWELLPASAPTSALTPRLATRTRYDDMGDPFTEDVLEVSIHTPLIDADGQRLRLRWEMEQAYRLTDDTEKVCYLSTFLLTDRVLVYNGAAVPADGLADYKLFETLYDYRFAEGYYLTLYQQSLSEGAFRYWDQVAQVLSRQGTIYDPPPAPILGNVSNPEAPDEVVYGYFYATTQDTLRHYVAPNEFGTLKPYCPLPPPMGPRGPTRCDDCLLGPNSSTMKPAYWIR